MEKFHDSDWAKPEFSREYRDKADIYVIERRKLHEILRSFYGHFLSGRRGNRVLDLGCGDGAVARELLSVDGSIQLTLIDGSGDMLDHAKRDLKEFDGIRFVEASFQGIIEGEFHLDSFDFIVSSLAIHHLTLGEKGFLFNKIYSSLTPGGRFVNIDLVKAEQEALEAWYMILWREWIEERKRSLGFEDDIFRDIWRRYKEGKDNKPDTLGDQLRILRETGFIEVDCYYKYGIFTIFGGKK